MEWVRQVRHALQGNKDAEALVFCYMRITHVWDDLIDKDNVPTDEEINRAFFHMWVTIPSNPFFVAYRQTLLPILANVIVNWQTANKLEQIGSDKALQISHMLRHSPVDIIVMCAQIIGGADWAAECAAPLRLSMVDGTYEEYVASVRSR